MMDTLQRGILVLIHSAVSGEAKSLPEGFDLEAALPMIRKHRIGNMVFYGATNCGVDTNLPLMKDLFLETYKYMRVDERQRSQLKKLFAAFDANGIEYMPVKGSLMKQMYPKTDMRIMGDADILIRMEQYDKVRPIMESLGYEEKLESDHELVWSHPGLYLELHKRLIPSYNKDYAAYYGDGWQLGHPGKENPLCYEMSDEDQLIYVFTHFAKHYRDGGVGLRHMTDLYVYKKVKPNLNESYILGELKKLQLDVFYGNVYETLDYWFEDGAETEVSDMVTKFIFASGVFGTHEGHVAAEGLRGSVGSNAKKMRMKKWWNLVFLPYGSMCIKYPVLKKVPILLPIMWPVRWISALLFKPKTISQQRNRMKMMTQECVDSYEKSLSDVGLGFHFEEKEQ